MYRKIVVAIDGSIPSLNGVDAAARLAALTKGELHIVNAPLPETASLVTSGIGGYVPMTPLPPDETLVEAGQQVVDLAAKQAEALGAEVFTYVRTGDVASRVIELADEIGADLIVTGRRGLGGLASLVLGSTSQRILHNAKCACLSVL